MSGTYAVIMAGGSGTRFWPLSRSARPKQLLPLGSSDTSLLKATVERIQSVIPASHTLVVTSEKLAARVREELPDVPAENILAEPTGRNTAPCVGWAASFVARRDPSAVLVVLPADHHIADEPTYLEILKRAIEAARAGDMVTVGIRPNRPETGYGYIELGEELDPLVHRARRFVEKPDELRARQFLASGKFLWNSGMFFFRADEVLSAIRAFLPGLGAVLTRYDEAAALGNEAAVVRETYPSLPDISIDHGIMEKAQRVLVIPGDFGWSDVGSWTSAWELAQRDDQGNAVFADLVAVDVGGSYVRAPEGKLVAIVGVQDMVVVDTGDALLIMPRERAQDVRAVVNELKRRQQTDVL